MREHQIVITLKPEQFVRVQKLAREAGAKSMGMFVRQQLLAALGIEGQAQAILPAGTVGAASAGAMNVEPMVTELKRLHMELREIVAESLVAYSSDLVGGVDGDEEGLPYIKACEEDPQDELPEEEPDREGVPAAAADLGKEEAASEPSSATAAANESGLVKQKDSASSFVVSPRLGNLFRSAGFAAARSASIGAPDPPVVPAPASESASATAAASGSAPFSASNSTPAAAASSAPAAASGSPSGSESGSTQVSSDSTQASTAQTTSASASAPISAPTPAPALADASTTQAGDPAPISSGLSPGPSIQEKNSNRPDTPNSASRWAPRAVPPDRLGVGANEIFGPNVSTNASANSTPIPVANASADPATYAGIAPGANVATNMPVDRVFAASPRAPEPAPPASNAGNSNQFYPGAKPAASMFENPSGITEPVANGITEPVPNRITEPAPNRITEPVPNRITEPVPPSRNESSITAAPASYSKADPAADMFENPGTNTNLGPITDPISNSTKSIQSSPESIIGAAPIAGVSPVFGAAPAGDTAPVVGRSAPIAGAASGAAQSAAAGANFFEATLPSASKQSRDPLSELLGADHQAEEEKRRKILEQSPVADDDDAYDVPLSILARRQQLAAQLRAVEEMAPDAKPTLSKKAPSEPPLGKPAAPTYSPETNQSDLPNIPPVRQVKNAAGEDSSASNPAYRPLGNRDDDSPFSGGPPPKRSQ